jgi:asparagine synthase (glutamine-hydrolysing)
MCGIMGAIALKPGGVIDRGAVERLVDRMVHRGPDSRGAVHRVAFSFACRRLAVTDAVPRSDQPFSDAENRITMVFNGEIYNYRNLRQELCTHGAAFRTCSDTEVIVEAYKQWGVDCLSRLNGMFAFALYDEQSQSFLVARDRVGIKPLYYAVFDDLLVFGSEIKAVAGYPGFRCERTAEAIVRFMRFRYVPFGDQYYKGLKKLAPGCLLSVAGARVEARRYWDVTLGQAPVDAGAERVSGLIADAVSSQVPSDAPASLFLSGGIDSSILALHAREVAPLWAFTAQVPGPAYDESDAATKVADFTGMKHCTVPISPALELEQIRQLIEVKDQPLGMHNELAMAQLASAAAKHGKVALCGEGADELFGGYSRMFRSPFSFARHAALHRKSGHGHTDESFWRYVLSSYFYMPDQELQALLRPEFHNCLHDEELADWIRTTCAQSGHVNRFQQICYFFLKLHLPGLLEMVDAATMSASLEARVPYTDHLLVELAFALPARRKLKWRSPWHAAAATALPLRWWSGIFDIPKAVLREAYYHRLPPAVFDTIKKGFPIPLGRWLSQNDEAMDLLLRRGSPLHEFFSPDALHAWHSRHLAQPDDSVGRRSWLLINLALFLEAKP